MKHDITTDGARQLVSAIFLTAINDYRRLKKTISKSNIDNVQREICEKEMFRIKEFFRSELADSYSTYLNFTPAKKISALDED